MDCPLWNTEGTGGPRRARLWNDLLRLSAVVHCSEGVPTGLSCLARKGCGHLPYPRRGAALGHLLVLVQFFSALIFPRLCRRFRFSGGLVNTAVTLSGMSSRSSASESSMSRHWSGSTAFISAGGLCFLSSRQSGRRAEPAAVHLLLGLPSALCLFSRRLATCHSNFIKLRQFPRHVARLNLQIHFEAWSSSLRILTMVPLVLLWASDRQGVRPEKPSSVSPTSFGAGAL